LSTGSTAAGRENGPWRGPFTQGPLRLPLKRHYHRKKRWLPAPSPRTRANPTSQTTRKTAAAIHKRCTANPAPKRIKTNSNARIKTIEQPPCSRSLRRFGTSPPIGSNRLFQPQSNVPLSFAATAVPVESGVETMSTLLGQDAAFLPSKIGMAMAIGSPTRAELTTVAGYQSTRDAAGSRKSRLTNPGIVCTLRGVGPFVPFDWRLSRAGFLAPPRSEARLERDQARGGRFSPQVECDRGLGD